MMNWIAVLLIPIKNPTFSGVNEAPPPMLTTKNNENIIKFKSTTTIP
jgi:hypothetical protein